MQENSTEKAKKLAAARKRLKEYQNRSSGVSSNISSLTPFQGDENASNNIFEKSDIDYNVSENTTIFDEKTPIEHFENDVKVTEQPARDSLNSETRIIDPASSELKTMQVLIAEKSHLRKEYEKYRNLCDEQRLELEDLRLQLNENTLNFIELQQKYSLLQKLNEQLLNRNAELEDKLAQLHSDHEDQSEQLQKFIQQVKDLEACSIEQSRKLKETSDKFEMALIRIKQLSDESSDNQNSDNQIEILMQTKLMHEQQIRDLQAMVQTFTQEKEQVNVQYQSYVQQLNAEISSLKNFNLKLQEENEQLKQRDQQMIQHVGSLEREIQKNINRQQREKLESKKKTATKNENQLKQKNSDEIVESYEYKLKVKSQEERVEVLQSELHQRQSEVKRLKENLEAMHQQQPNQNKILAIMESDKIAASRALSQNVELKKQLDELENRFVQLTNDKAELRNRLDAEEFANRDIRHHYDEMQERFKNIEERLKFKDEEMIRLAHENAELNSQIINFQKELPFGDNQQNKENKYEIINEPIKNVDDSENCDMQKEIHDKNNTDVRNEDATISKTDSKEDLLNFWESKRELSPISTEKKSIPSSEAMDFLQQRFTKLMNQIADLTEEKLRLEHLVLQLQGETETIGEYITLYQTQRRMLKQREYEKAAQMQILQTEREELCEKIKILNNLVSTLSAELPTVKFKSNNIGNEKTYFKTESDAQEFSIEKTNKAMDGSLQILNKMHCIISEIERNTKEPLNHYATNNVEQLNCCSGKFEVV